MRHLDETTLRSVLRERAGRPNVPVAPIDELLDGGRLRVRRRRRRAAARVGAAAAVLAVAVALAAQPTGPRSDGPVGPTPSTPTPSAPTDPPRMTLADLPRGDLPSVPFVVNDVLYTNGGTTDIEDGHIRLSIGGDGVVASWTEGRQGQPSAVHLVDPSTGERTTRLAADADGPPVVSADGRFVAWEDDDADGTARVRIWDVDAAAEDDPVSFPFTPTCCDNPFLVVGIDARGQLYGSGGGSYWVVSTTSRDEPHVVLGLGADAEMSIRQVAAGLLLVDSYGAPLKVGRLDGDHRFSKDFEVNASAGSISPDEQRLVYVTGDNAVHVRALATGRETMVSLPTDVSVHGPPTWETPSAILVQVQADPVNGNAWVRCLVGTGRCEVATMFPSEDVSVPSP